ncbi:Gfo/Idh/MocA family oxidoreductase [Chloroflexi bacterium TSY]|nr:Gfo/Idh/MocA family oxidoreductase [Chloroflexi bacterium TSY]
MQKTCRAGVIGLTGIAANRPATDPMGILNTPSPSSHIGAYTYLPQTELVAVCELKSELFGRMKETWGPAVADVQTYTDYRKMIEQENLDLLSVCTSDNLHTEIVIAAANAKIGGIVCEKPLATTVDECTQMIEACQANGTVMTVDHTNRWLPHYHVAREAIRSGTIGKVQRIVGHLGGPRAMLFRNGTHLIDGVCFFAESDPEWVFAELEPGYDHYSTYQGDGGRDPATDPAGSGYIHFRNGVRAFVNASKEQYEASFSFQIMGETGQLDVHNSQVIRRDRHTTERFPFPRHQLTGIPACIAELIQVMENGGEVLSPPQEAKKTVEILIGFLQSHTRGNVRVDLPLPVGH